MLSESRLWVWGVMAAGGALLLAGTACGGGQTCTVEPGVFEVVTTHPAADQEAALPDDVALPEGFYPLLGHYDLNNPDDHYNGWPRYIVCHTDGMVMAYVPSQTLMMGGGTDLDEVPARTVVVKHFYMDIHEVTNAQFARYAGASPTSVAGHDKEPGFARYWITGLNDHCPARNVSWFEATNYSHWGGRQLPSEAQWEAAARGQDKRIYPWGNDTQSDLTRYLCNAKTDRAGYDGYESAAPVMNYAAGVSPFGIYNLAGNVREWCSDWYDPGRYAYPSDEDPPTGLERGPKAFGDRNYPNPLAKDTPDARVGPAVGGQRAIRGGSFADPIEKCRVDSRTAAHPAERRQNLGFRCVLPLP